MKNHIKSESIKERINHLLSTQATTKTALAHAIGMDVWEIDSIGRIISRTENKDKDEIFTVTSSGDTTSVSFAYGTIEQQENRKVGDEVKYTWFDVRGDENGTKLFEFFCE